ncbi:MAG: thioredoxin family protein [Gammaproteobacteria bacterium]|nr:thioredoxin family protein [Gammaproteobacteria bacterium]MDH3465715.1 thioredoxin family protein [Gammaproteobacteria bacterium]
MPKPAYLIILLLGLITTFPASADTIRDPGVHFFQDSFGDFQEEAGIAAEQGLFGVMIMFEATDCPWCERMKQHVLNQVAVQDYYRQHFRILTVNIDGDIPLTDFGGNTISEKDFSLKQHRVRATPAFLFFDTNGKLATRYTGASRDAQEFLWLGEFVVDGHYQNRRFPEFKRQKRAALNQS